MADGDPVWRELVYRGVESDELDYKSAMNWNTMPRAARAKIIRHCLAFANTRGGYLVIGVGEDAAGHPSVYQGLSPEETHSFDPSTVTPFINHLVDPPIDFTIERPEIDGKRYAIFVIKPFTTLPHVCASGVEGELQQGVFYIRTRGASSRPAVSALELHEIIRRALRNQRAQLGQMLRGILYETRDLAASGESAERRFSVEEEQFRRYLATHRSDPAAGIPVEFYVRPAVYESMHCSLRRLRRGARTAAGAFFPEPEAESLYSVNTALRAFDAEQGTAAEFFQSGLLCRSLDLPGGEGRLSVPVLKSALSGFVRFAGKFYAGMGMEESMLELVCRVPRAGSLRLVWAGGETPLFGGETASAQLDASASELNNAPDAAAERLFRVLGEQFLLPERELRQ